jgi:hypothetical protein
MTNAFSILGGGREMLKKLLYDQLPWIVSSFLNQRLYDNRIIFNLKLYQTTKIFSMCVIM